MTDVQAEDRRRVRWSRFEPYGTNLHLVVSEIGDDLDEYDARWDQLDRRIARLTGIAVALLVSTCTGVFMLALNLMVIGSS